MYCICRAETCSNTQKFRCFKPCLLVFRVSPLNYSHSNDEINLFPVICAQEDEKGNVVQSVLIFEKETQQRYPLFSYLALVFGEINLAHTHTPMTRWYTSCEYILEKERAFLRLSLTNIQIKVMKSLLVIILVQISESLVQDLCRADDRLRKCSLCSRLVA